jgi:hypothetical protein
MRYTKPTILNVSKAASLIMGTSKATDKVDNPSIPNFTDGAAYEADE